MTRWLPYLLSLPLVSSSALGSAGRQSRHSEQVTTDPARLTTGERGAIVAVLRAGRLQCTGIVVGASRVLTDAHCVKVNHGLEVELEDQASRVRSKRRVVGSAKHRWLDAAVLELAAPVPSWVEPLRLAQVGATEPEVGATLHAAGRGQGSGVTVLTSTLRSRGSELEIGYPDQQRGLCRGDSGGPLFTREADGRLRVWGLLRGGALGCRGPDRFTRVAQLVDWLKSVEVLRRPRRD